MHMRSFAYFLICVFIAAASTAAFTRDVQKISPFAKPPVRIVIFGDDLTSGTGIAAPEDKFPALLSNYLKKRGDDFTITNASVDGETTSSAISRVPPILAQKPDIVIISVGTNDGLRQVDPEIVRNNLEQILTQFNGKAYVLFTGAHARPTLGLEYAGRFNEVYPNLVERHKVVFFPFLLDGIAGRPEYFQRDTVHLNEDGVAYVAQKLWPVLHKMVNSY